VKRIPAGAKNHEATKATAVKTTDRLPLSEQNKDCGNTKAAATLKQVVAAALLLKIFSPWPDKIKTPFAIPRQNTVSDASNGFLLEF
jgi:hypothetical protein